MCTLVVIRQLLQDAPLILAANRDEAYARPWQSPTHHPPPTASASPARCYPVDRSAGGTWIGVNALGLAVAVTNRRPVPPSPHLRSRGLLCADVLASPSILHAHQRLEAALDGEPYNDFNMVVATADDAFVLHHEAAQTRVIPLPPGVHILTNFHDLDDPIWHATRAHLTEQAKLGSAALNQALKNLLASHTPAPDGHLTCKHGRNYGTLCSSLIHLSPQHPPTFHFAPGPPCTTDFTPFP